MKHLLRCAGAVALIAALAACASAPEAPPGPITLQTVHEAPGRSPAALCAAAREWALSRMPGTRMAPEMVEPLRMLARGQAPSYSMAGPVLVDFSLQVECRDGRARSTIESTTAWHGGASVALVSGGMLRLRENAETRLREVESGLAAALRGAPGVGAW
jgi:hypothetical protein